MQGSQSRSTDGGSRRAAESVVPPASPAERTTSRKPDSRRCLIVFALLPWLSGCLLLAGRHWEQTRQSVIEPINSAIHRHLARDIKAKNLDAVLSAYATETGTGLGWNDALEMTEEFSERRIRWQGPSREEPIRERYRRLFDLFDGIDKAEVRIHRIRWDHTTPDGFPADLRVIVRGVSPQGHHQTLDQRLRVTVARAPGGQWALASEEVVSRELVFTPSPHFELATEAAGVRDVHDTSGAPIFRLIGDMTLASGSAVADVDCDGFEDLALLSASRLRLYRNLGDGTFADVTESAGFSAPLEVAGTGLVFFDAENDGDPDLWVCGIHGERFFRNRECAVFQDDTTRAGLQPSRWSSMPIVADYDLDGFLDVYVVRMGDHEHAAPEPNWQAANGERDTLYRNNGDGTFSDATRASRIDERGWGLAGAWGDYNDDGYPDLYVGNEFGFNSLYRNDRDGTFTNVAAEAGALDRAAAMGVTWGDYDNDGDLDLFVNNMYANSRWALFHPEFPPPVPWYFSWIPRSEVDGIIEELTRGSTLLRNEGDGTFSDVSEAAGVRDCQWGWGAEFLDYDNDGRLDLYAANGFVSGPLLDDV
jgi:hypothetical protein